MELITVKEYNQRFEAERDLELLRQNQIEAMLKSDDAGGSMPNLGFEAYQILVAGADAEKAKSLLC